MTLDHPPRHGLRAGARRAAAVPGAAARRAAHRGVRRRRPHPLPRRRRRLDVTVVEAPTGLTYGRGGPLMRVHRPEEFYARLGRDGLIGFGESYLTGAWDADDLAGFLTVPAARMATLVPESLQRLRALVTHRTPSHQRSTEDNSQANISHHYDLSNDLFALFLDETLSYSSALFDTSVTGRSAPASAPPSVAAPPEGVADPTAGDRDLAEAQGRKIERLLDEAGVTAGSRVLEIGTGWGELAIRAARRGAGVHSITLSVEQLELAEKRVADAGLSDRVRIELMDYRALGRRGDVRRGGLGRDDRGRRPRVLGHLLPDHRPGARARAAGSPSRPSPCRTTGCWPPAGAHLDQQVHLPRRFPAQHRGHRPGHPRARPPCG